MEIWSKSLAETKAVAQAFLVKISSLGKKNLATIVGLHGDLGSGKTTFTQAVAEILGIKERVTSPTFVIMKSYILPKKWQGRPLPWGNLVHVDAYRLDSAEELEKLNWREIMTNPSNLILIEWPERVLKILPTDLVSINFKFIDEVTRKISYD